MLQGCTMEHTQLNWIANFIWGIADDVLPTNHFEDGYRMQHLHGHIILEHYEVAWHFFARCRRQPDRHVVGIKSGEMRR